jgi:hypothetical protein
MFTKTSIALAVLVALSSGAVAVEKRAPGAANAYTVQGGQGSGITLPSTTPEGNRKGWFMEW